MDKNNIEEILQYAFAASGLYKACDDLKITHLLDSAEEIICKKLLS